MFKKYAFLLPYIVILFFIPALTGPLLLDDTVHLGPVFNWLSDQSDTVHLIFGNKSGPFGRPISLISFVLNVLTTGGHIWSLKFTNLLLHLATGLCLAKLLYRLFLRDLNFGESAKIASIIVSSLWLVLPQHIATVFYVIQRMSILASLFAVIACWFYVVARERIEMKQSHYPLFLLGVIFFTVLSVLSKESGLLIPLFCLLIECIYFRSTAEKPRPQLIIWGFRLGVFLPCILVAAYVTFTPSFVLHGYTDRLYSLQERGMTQLSVVADYFVSTFIPLTRSAGVYNDDFPIAVVWTTKETLLLLIGVCLMLAAIRLRKNLPSFSFGIGLFFAGHLLESTIFPLEIYFVHRNYLPSIGLVIATSGLVARLCHTHPQASVSLKRILPLAFCCLFLAYGVATYSRARLWSDNGALLTHAQIHHPTSSRLRSELIMAALYGNRLDIALQQADLALQTASPDEKRTIQLWRILAYCYARTTQPNSELEALRHMPADRITMNTSTALDYVSAAAEANACPGLNREKLGHLVNQWAINTIQYPSEAYVWRTHQAAARLLASSGDLEAGFKQASWAFKESGYDFNAGLLAYQLANNLEDSRRAEEVMTLLVENQARYTDKQQTQLRMLRKQ